MAGGCRHSLDSFEGSPLAGVAGWMRNLEVRHCRSRSRSQLESEKRAKVLALAHHRVAKSVQKTCICGSAVPHLRPDGILDRSSDSHIPYPTASGNFAVASLTCATSECVTLFYERSQDERPFQTPSINFCSACTIPGNVRASLARGSFPPPKLTRPRFIVPESSKLRSRGSHAARSRVQ